MLTTEEMQVSHTAENLSERLHEIIYNWELEGKNITFVTDNAGEMKKATSILGKFPWLSCGGHVLNLVASSAFDNVTVSTLITKCKNIVGFIKRSTNAANALCDQQRQMGYTELTVLQECCTRWWSILDMILRILEIKEPFLILKVCTIYISYANKII